MSLDGRWRGGLDALRPSTVVETTYLTLQLNRFDCKTLLGGSCFLKQWIYKDSGRKICLRFPWINFAIMQLNPPRAKGNHLGNEMPNACVDLLCARALLHNYQQAALQTLTMGWKSESLNVQHCTQRQDYLAPLAHPLETSVIALSHRSGNTLLASEQEI